MTVSTYDSKIREIGHHTRDCDGKKFIIINQTYWYDADLWTDETAAEDFMNRLQKQKRELNSEKAKFIEHELTALCRKIDGDIDYLQYETTEFDEYCIIRYKDAARAKVCITCNSNAATTQAVIEKIM